jgi:hypothetical protein
MRPCPENTQHQKRTGGVAQIVDHLREDLSLNSSSAKKKKKKKKKYINF